MFYKTNLSIVNGRVYEKAENKKMFVHVFEHKNITKNSIVISYSHNNITPYIANNKTVISINKNKTVVVSRKEAFTGEDIDNICEIIQLKLCKNVLAINKKSNIKQKPIRKGER